MENAADFKVGVESKMSNLSCVLQSMGAIDADFKINREILTTDIWKMQDLYATDNLADPVWRAKMTTMFTDCIDLAESICWGHVLSSFILLVLQLVGKSGCLHGLLELHTIPRFS